jgi:hypothetical protein
MTPEAKVKKKIKLALANLGAYYAMPATGGYGSSGVPDFLVCLRGRFVAIEAKAGKGKATALQEFNLRIIRETGGVALIVNESNVDQLEEILNEEVKA